MSGIEFRVRGLVQGVGFRPHVWRLAGELGLRGWVRNDGAGVTIAVDGNNLPEFRRRLMAESPPLARIDAIEERPVTVDGNKFTILDSQAGAVTTAIGPDAACCADCLAEMCDPAGRRWRHAFITCTHCGPRHTVSRGIPYDRSRTSLAPFPLCPACAAEYADPVDRRFHAETTGCPACGPRLQLLDAAGREVAGDPLAETLAWLRAGRIVAIKGLGGFHLACDARQPQAVAALRRRKQREARPFALMALNAASLAGLAEIAPDEAALLNAPAAPIVLCRKGPAELPGVAPGVAWLGVMHPATPLHLLLWHEAAGRPAGTAWRSAASELLLVMTSANPRGEPLVTGNDEAVQRLAGLADGYLLHDREVVVRSDDSVLRSTAAGPRFLRRSRGYVPVPLALVDDGPPGLALGAFQKATVCVLKGRQAWLSQHVGGLDNPLAIDFLADAAHHLLDILAVRPAWIAHDLHPDFPSTRLARQLAQALAVPAVAVGHHQAHLAAICAEHGVDSPVIGLIIDGFGLGPDGAAWGGEMLRLAQGRCVRLGHLAPLALPGGDRAAREPWRMAVAALHAAGLGAQIAGWLDARRPAVPAGPMRAMLDRRLNCPPTSSLGRWFDAAAGLLGVCDVSAYDGQAPMRLESLALAHGPVDPLAGGYRLSADGRQLDLTPLVPALLACRDAACGAALFHATLAAGLANWLKIAVDREKIGQIAIGGGCALNEVLLSPLRRELAAAGLRVLEAQLAPPGDGGLALGQAWLARQWNKELHDVSGHTGAGG